MQMSACSQLLCQRPREKPSPVKQICTDEHSKVVFQCHKGLLPADIAFVPKVSSSAILFFFSPLFFLLSLFLSPGAISGKRSHISYISIRDTAKWEFTSFPVAIFQLTLHAVFGRNLVHGFIYRRRGAL